MQPLLQIKQTKDYADDGSEADHLFYFHFFFLNSSGFFFNLKHWALLSSDPFQI